MAEVGAAPEARSAPALPYHSEVIEEIIEHVPHAVVRWGITGWCLLLLVAVGISYAVKYPDLVVAPITLQAFNGPKPVPARVTGMLQQLLVREGQKVAAHTPLAYLESQADPVTVRAMAVWADTLSRRMAAGQEYTLAQQEQFRRLDQRGLGEVQEAFQAFNIVHYQFLASRDHGFYPRKKALLAAELRYLKRQYTSLQAQQHLHQQGLALARSEFDAQQDLFRQGVTSKVDYRQEESKLLRQRLIPQQAQDALTQNLTQQLSKQQELMALDQMAAEQRTAFWSALNAFRSALLGWQKQYVLTAPVTGTAHFTSLLQPNQFAEAGTILFYVTPQESRMYGEAAIMQVNFGKVQPGQRVNIKFKGYPFQQYGLVQGQVSFIASLPSSDGTFQVMITLPNGLRTTHNQLLRNQVGMQGQAEIITADLRLLERFTYFVRGSLSTGN